MHAKSDWPLAILAVGFSVEENINLLLRIDAIKLTFKDKCVVARKQTIQYASRAALATVFTETVI